MFAVVFKRVGEKWLPISGSPATGWTVAANDDWKSIREANLYRFVLSSSGSYTAMIDELPGDVKKYEEAVGVEEEGRYRIVYYFSNQNELEAIDKGNTFEITSPMNRVAAVNLYVPNIRNDLTVQKLDQNGNLITGGRATFELRPASDGTYNPSATAAQTRTEITSEGEGNLHRHSQRHLLPCGNRRPRRLHRKRDPSRGHRQRHRRIRQRRNGGGRNQRGAGRGPAGELHGAVCLQGHGGHHPEPDRGQVLYHRNRGAP